MDRQQLASHIEARGDSNQRITLELPLVDVLRDTHDVVARFTGAAWIEAAHVTVIHVGKADELLRELSAQGLSATRLDLSSALANSWWSLLESAPAHIDVEVARMGEFAGNSVVPVVLQLQRHCALDVLRRMARQAFTESLESLGVASPGKFVESSQTIAEHPSWRPHLTIRFRASTEVAVDELRIKPGELKLRLGKLRLR